MSIGSVSAAARRAVELAEVAAARGTFGVGGVLLGPHFELLHECRNRVVLDGRTIDPTAHVERQLIDWYFRTRRNGVDLPPARHCTIVSSLDPCMQCAGAILTAGFRCVAIAPDPMAGVHSLGWNSVGSLPSELGMAAAQCLGSFGIAGERRYVGPNDPILAAVALEPSLLARSKSALAKTLNIVQETVAAVESESAPLPIDLNLMSPESRNLLVEALPRGGDREVYHRMTAVAARTLGGRVTDLACFLDHKNSIAVFAQARTSESPIRTALMELVRCYAKLRWTAARKHGAVPSHPKNCTLYTLAGPGRDAQSVMALGAVGSTLEGPVARPRCYWRYFRARQSPAELSAMLRAFPPLYSEVIGIEPILAFAEND